MAKCSGWIIEQDHINKTTEECYRKGKHSHDWSEDCRKIAIKFRAYDDDNILYYSGLLVDDDYADGQQRVLDWTMHDAGCTYIKVFKNGKWVIEID